MAQLDEIERRVAGPCELVSPDCGHSPFRDQPERRFPLSFLLSGNHLVENKSDVPVISLIALAHGTSHFFQIIVARLFPLIRRTSACRTRALGFSMALF